MQVVIPNILEVLFASVPEDEAPLWDSTTTYTPESENAVIYKHYIYECLVENTNKPPDQNYKGEGAPWRLIDPTNAWAAVIDIYGYTKTRALEGETELEIWVPFKRPANSVYLMDVDASTVKIVLEDEQGVIYEEEQRLLEDSGSWNNYWRGGFLFKKDYGVNELPLVTGTLKIHLTGQRPAVGRIIVGQRTIFGETEYGAQGGLIDYSINTTDGFGNEVWVRRRNARKISFSALMAPDNVNYIQQTISRNLAGVPALYIGDNNVGYEPLIVFGFLREYDVTYVNISTARVTLDVRGIT